MTEPKRKPGRPSKLPPGDRRTIACVIVNGEKKDFDDAREKLGLSQLEFTRAAILHAVRVIVDGGLAPFDPLAGVDGSLPITGAIGAGPGIDEAAFDGDVIRLSKIFTTGRAAYVVRGDSMRDAAILNGDVIIVRLTPDPTPGETVVAWIDEHSGCVLKRFEGRGEKRWLESPDGWRHDLTIDDRGLRCSSRRDQNSALLI